MATYFSHLPFGMNCAKKEMNVNKTRELVLDEGLRKIGNAFAHVTIKNGPAEVVLVLELGYFDDNNLRCVTQQILSIK